MELCFQQPTIALPIYDYVYGGSLFVELEQLDSLAEARVIDNVLYRAWRSEKTDELKSWRHYIAPKFPVRGWRSKYLQEAFALFLGWCLKRQVYEPVITLSQTCLAIQWLLQPLTMFHVSGKCGFGHEIVDFELIWARMGPIIRSDHDCERHQALSTFGESYWRPVVFIDDFQLNAQQAVYFGSGFIDQEKLIWLGINEYGNLQISIKRRPPTPKRIKLVE